MAFSIVRSERNTLQPIGDPTGCINITLEKLDVVNDCMDLIKRSLRLSLAHAISTTSYDLLS
jgi:hypothetical protein